MLEITHHATLILHPCRKEYASSLFKNDTKESLSNLFLEKTVLDIESARSLSAWAITPHSGHKRAIISFHTITEQAQNALLKTLEEPPQNVSFILITSNKESLLPTLLSRLEEHVIDENFLEEKNIATFLATEPLDRMDLPYIKKLLTKEDEEGRKDREEGKKFFLMLFEYMVRNTFDTHHQLLVLSFASYAKDPSSSLKTLLEYTSLVLPKYTS
jgi:hypothetical protein